MCNTCGYVTCQCPPLVSTTPCDPCTQTTGCKVLLPAECVTINNTTVKDFLQCTNLLNYIYNCIVGDPVQYAKFCALWAACNGQQTCLAPANISVGAIDSTSATVSWQVLAGVTYEVFLDNVSVQTNATSPLVLSGLTPSTSYTVRVVSTCTNGITNFAVAQFTTTSVANLEFTWTRTAGDLMDLNAKVLGSYNQIDWGDGTINTSLSHLYSVSGSYTVKFYNSTATTVILGNKFGASIYKLTNVASIPNTVEILNLGNNTLTTIPSLTPLTNLKTLDLYANQLTTINTTSNTLLERFVIAENLISGTLNITTNVNLENIEIQNNAFTNVIGTSSCPLIELFGAGSNNLSVSTVNSILTALDSSGVTNGLLQLDNQTPAAAPTGGGITAKNNLTANGWTVSTD
jgi:hypothetical protein